MTLRAPTESPSSSSPSNGNSASSVSADSRISNTGARSSPVTQQWKVTMTNLIDGIARILSTKSLNDRLESVESCWKEHFSGNKGQSSSNDTLSTADAMILFLILAPVAIAFPIHYFNGWTVGQITQEAFKMLLVSAPTRLHYFVRDQCSGFAELGPSVTQWLSYSVILLVLGAYYFMWGMLLAAGLAFMAFLHIVIYWSFTLHTVSLGWILDLFELRAQVPAEPFYILDHYLLWRLLSSIYPTLSSHPYAAYLYLIHAVWCIFDFIELASSPNLVFRAMGMDVSIRAVDIAALERQLKENQARVESLEAALAKVNAETRLGGKED